jgi:hypothetical protein
VDYAQDGNNVDLLGDTAQGGFTNGFDVNAPALTPDQMAADRERKKQWLANQGLDENGNQLPAYGTSAGNGGTATGWAVMADHPGSHVIHSTQLGSNDELVPGADVNRTVVNTGGAPGAPSAVTHSGTVGVGDTGLENAIGQTHGSIASDGTRTPSGTVMGGAGDIGKGGGAILDQTVGATKDLRAGLAADQLRGRDNMQGALSNATDMNPLVNRGLTQTAANQAGAALGPASTVEQGLADRGLADYNSAQGASRQVLDQLMNGPSTTARIGSQVLRNQLALARSAPTAGGAQMALQNAQAQAPELQAQAAQSAVAENVQRQQAAGQIAQGQTQNALGARGQDVDIAKSNQAAGMRLTDNIAQLTGQQLQLNQQSQELLGRMATDMNKQDFDWSKLSADQQQAELDRWVKVYGIDQDVAAKIKIAASAGGDKGVLDYLIPIIGSAAQLGAAAL